MKKSEQTTEEFIWDRNMAQSSELWLPDVNLLSHWTRISEGVGEGGGASETHVSQVLGSVTTRSVSELRCSQEVNQLLLGVRHMSTLTHKTHIEHTKA